MNNSSYNNNHMICTSNALQNNCQAVISSKEPLACFAYEKKNYDNDLMAVYMGAPPCPLSPVTLPMSCDYCYGYGLLLVVASFIDS